MKLKTLLALAASAFLLFPSFASAQEVPALVITPDDFEYDPIVPVPDHYFKIGPVFASNIIEEDKSASTSKVTYYDSQLNEFSVSFPFLNIFSSRRFGYADIKASNSDEFYTPLTQTFFNEDENYETVIASIFTKSSYSSYISEFKVVNNLGDVLYTFAAPEGQCFMEGPTFYKASDETIIAIALVGGYNRNGWTYENEAYLYYLLKRSQIGVEAIPAKVKISAPAVRPNPIRQGETLNIKASMDNGTMSLHTIDGTKVTDIKVNDGNATLSTSNLPKGMYLLRENGTKSRTAKIIVD